MKGRTIQTMTITGVPASMGQPGHVESVLFDAVVSVDFALIAAELSTRAAFSKSKKATALDGAIVVKATNLRGQTEGRT